MPARYVMKCPHCGSPVADTLRLCPYCDKKIGIEALGMHGGLESDGRGGLTIGAGAHVVVGAAAGEERQCPFCGARNAASEKRCAYCKSKIVLESLWMRRLVVKGGGSLHVKAGGKVHIGRPRPASQALLAASAAGDLAAIKARLDAGDEIDGASEDGVAALHAAAWRGPIEAVRYLLAMGATVTDKDAHGRTPEDVARQRGDAAIVQLLSAHRPLSDD